MCCNNRYRVTLIICQDSLIVDRIAEFDHLSWFIGIVLKIAHAALDTYMSCEITTLNSSREIATCGLESVARQEYPSTIKAQAVDRSTIQY